MTKMKGLLVRASAGTGAALAEIAALAGGDDLEPLFTVEQTERIGFTEPGVKQWFRVPQREESTSSAWDAAHEEYQRRAGMAGLNGVGVDFIEPDLEQEWISEPPAENEILAADVCAFQDQNPSLPSRPGEFAWHLNAGFSQLRAARTAVAASGAIIRIAHLDTGYDPNHSTFPGDRVETNLQRNFVDSDRPNDARDTGADGVGRNPGHGPGTLGILAGRRFAFTGQGYSFNEELGAVVNARIVPVRVGTSVIQLTTSSVAQAINYAATLCEQEATRVHVISMSMGGVASQAWADAVNKVYERGVIYVAAAGNNFSAGFFGFPTHQIVYPARFRRVIAACGVMANRQPYYNLPTGTMQGNWGPTSAMSTAVSAFTPNMPWAHMGCPQLVSLDGAGTSSATPQIAATAALYLMHHHSSLFDKNKYPEPWMRVEAVRRAIYLTADKTADGGSREKLGNGILQAASALESAPAPRQFLSKMPLDSAGFPFLNVLSGSTSLAEPAADEMLRLEATQLVHRWKKRREPNPLEDVVSDPDRQFADVPIDQVRDFLDVVSRHPEASSALKRRASEVLNNLGGRHGPRVRPTVAHESSAATAKTLRAKKAQKLAAQSAKLPTVARPSLMTPPQPPFRAIRAYASDPSLATSLDTVAISELTFHLPWEKLKPGPVDEYLEVIDIDPASKTFYEPVDLDNPLLLAQDGLPPSEGVPQFHQQMVYAIARLTIANFERALGRRTLWRPKPPGKGDNPHDDSVFVRRLRIYPHALREANAYYSTQKVALLFGYFNAFGSGGDRLPGSKVFTCLSHDIVAHETTHALLDGMHRQFLTPSNPDVRAFHEGFADCVAMLQHFTFPELVAHQISITRGALNEQENLLVQLASQFGEATGKRSALRDAIGQRDENNVWHARKVDPSEYATTMRAHDRGRILVSAVFDAFLSIYKRRTADLLRLATDGRGILAEGAVHPDLVQRLADEASRAAQHVLTMCIRALDYCPPTDITFGEFLRAVVTADHDLVADDKYNYRVSFIEAFRRRGIFPNSIRTLSLGSLLWRSPEEDDVQPSSALLDIFKRLRGGSDDHLFASSREEIFNLQRQMRIDMHGWLKSHFDHHVDGENDARFLGLDPDDGFEVHAARIAHRSSPDGSVFPQLLIKLLQRAEKPVDPHDPQGPKMNFEGGSTVVVDLRAKRVQYCIRKSLSSSGRLERQQAFALAEFDSLRATYFGMRSLQSGAPGANNPLDEPFALIHRN